MKEVYLPIKNYEDLYEVSNLGSIRSIDRYNIDKNGKRKFYPGRQLKADLNIRNHTTYLRVTLSKDGKTKRFSVHQLVASAFIINSDNRPFVNHIDNNGTNNTVANLEWCTHSENMVHAQKQKRLLSAQSKGGKTLGKNIENRIKDKINSLINTKVGEWEVGDYLGPSKNTCGYNSHMFSCLCSCGYSLAIEMNRLLNKKTLRCKRCSVKANTIKAIHNLVSSSNLFTGNYKLSNKVAPDKKFSFYEVFTDNGTTEYISYHLAIKLVT